MGSMACPHCGETIPLFDSLDGTTIQDALGLPLLARLPWKAEIAQARELRWSTLPKEIQSMADGLAAEVELAVAASKPKAGTKDRSGRMDNDTGSHTAGTGAGS
jgi:hypothetical protein